MEIESVLNFFGQIIAYGGGAAVIAYLLFRYLGKAWIESKFSERLELLRHDQARELEKLRVEIDSLLSGKIKLQEKEFEILPKAWAKLDDARGQVSSLVSPMQTFADVDRMNSDQLSEFLDSTEFTNSQKKEISDSRKKSDAYQEILFRYRIHYAKKAFGDLQNYVARNGIFLDRELKEKFSKIATTLWSAIVSKEVGHDANDWNMQIEGWKKIEKETQPLFEEIEDFIQCHLQSHGKTP